MKQIWDFSNEADYEKYAQTRLNKYFTKKGCNEALVLFAWLKKNDKRIYDFVLSQTSDYAYGYLYRYKNTQIECANYLSLMRRKQKIEKLKTIKK